MKPEKIFGDPLEQEFECPRRDDLGAVETPYYKQIVVAGDQIVALCGKEGNRDILLITAIEKTKVSRTVVSLYSLDKTDPEIDALWAQEAEDRLAAYDRGEIEALNADAVLAEVREQLKR
jgi:hypothetical protein